MKTHEMLRRYVERKKTQYGVSIRSIASQLEVSPSFLSRMLSGKKPVPYKLLLKMPKALDIDPEVFETIRAAHVGHCSYFASEVPARGERDMDSELETWELSEKDTFKVLRNWYYLPILEFTSLSQFQGTASSIAKRFGLAVETVEVALRELKGLDLVEQKSDGLWRKTKKKIRWSSSVALSDIGRFHKGMMDKAKEVLEKKGQRDYEKRLITGLTLTISPSNVSLAKSRINEFLHELSNDLIDQNDPKAEVYHLATQFFPVSKSEDTEC